MVVIVCRSRDGGRAGEYADAFDDVDAGSIS